MAGIIRHGNNFLSSGTVNKTIILYSITSIVSHVDATPPICWYLLATMIPITPRQNTGDETTLCRSQHQIAKMLLTQALSFGISNTGLCFTVQLAITDSDLFPPFSLGWR